MASQFQTIKTQLKKNIFESPQFNQMIENLHGYIRDLTPEEKRSIRNGRYRNYYAELEKCVEGTFTGEQKCFKNIAHSKCHQEFDSIASAINTPIWKNNKQLRLQKTMDYFVCIDQNVRKIFLSSVLKF